MLHLSRYLHLACELLFFLFCFVLFSRSMTLKLGWEISERGERKQRREKKKHIMEKAGNDGDKQKLKYQFQKYPEKKKKENKCIPIPSQLRAWRVLAPWRSQPAPKIPVWDVMWWDHHRASVYKNCWKILYSWGWRSHAAEVNENSPLILVYWNLFFLTQTQSAALVKMCFLFNLCCCAKRALPWVFLAGLVPSDRCSCDAFLKAKLEPVTSCSTSFSSTGMVYSVKNNTCKILSLPYNGDCNAPAEMLVHWESLTDPVSQALETKGKSTFSKVFPILNLITDS